MAVEPVLYGSSVNSLQKVKGGRVEAFEARRNAHWSLNKAQSSLKRS